MTAQPALIVEPQGVLRAGDRAYRCALGPAGVTSAKREGDGATPAGRFPLRRVLYRPDRIAAPETGLPCAPLTPNDGWCDAPGDPNYNRPVLLPYEASAEALWREDAVYDVIVILGHNDDPPVPGAGSAIFFHLAHDDYRPTEGCVAVARPDMLEILRDCDERTLIEVLSD